MRQSLPCWLCTKLTSCTFIGEAAQKLGGLHKNFSAGDLPLIWVYFTVEFKAEVELLLTNDNST
jgi:hypothetical protein